MKILVTGGAGFIGSHLVEELVKNGNNEVWIQDDFSTGTKKNIEHIDRLHRIWAHGINIMLLSEDFDVVYHLAAKRSVPLSFEIPHEFFKVNIDGTWDILNKYKKARVVNISSSSAEQCLSPYAISKKTAENLAALHPNAVNLRLFNVFGERQANCGAIVPEFAKSMLKSKTPTVYGDGNQTRDFTYVKDVVNEIIEYGQGRYRDCMTSVVHEVGYKQSRTVNDMFAEIAHLCRFADSPIYEDAREGDIKFSKAKAGMYKPKYGFSKGLQRTIKWIKEAKPYETDM